MLEQLVENLVLNYFFRLKNEKKSRSESQSAGNYYFYFFFMRCNTSQPSNIGSSETIREALQFDDYAKLGQPEHIPNVDKSFLEWFIGFTEGDGSFDQSKLAFIVNQKDPKLLFKIKKKLGFGSVYKTSNPGIWRYSVTGKRNCLRLYYLFNGNFILTKTQNRFYKWVQNLDPPTPIKESKVIITLKTAWLAGFIEADGGFYARVRKNTRTKVGLQLQKKFYVTQKGEHQNLQQILNLLNSNSNVYKFRQNEEIYNRIDIASFQSHDILLNYLNKFSLLGSKNISVCIWKKIHGRQNRSEHLTLEGLIKIQRLCSFLNKANQ